MIAALAIVGIFILSVGASRAESLSLTDQFKKFPALKTGIAWDVEDSQMNYLSTIEIVKWKGLALEAGYAGAQENTGNKAVAVISYQLLKLKDLGVTLPILDLVEFNVGMYAGYGKIHIGEFQNEGNNEFSWGPSLSLINIKF